MATKRRKMWAVVDDEGRGSQVFLSRKRAVAWAAKEPRDGTGWHVVPYLERLPGDVVRTKDEEIALESAIDRYTEAWEMAYATHTDEARRAVTVCGWNLRVLLRGRR